MNATIWSTVAAWTLVEAEDKNALARGLQGLEIRVAKAVNRASRRKGHVFADRYHARILKTPAEVRKTPDQPTTALVGGVIAGRKLN